MRWNKLTVDGGFLLLIAAAVFFDAGRLFCVAVIAAAVHELGHYLALRRAGCHVTGIRLGLTGFSMEYAGALSYRGEVLTAAAGPAAGIVLAVIAAIVGRCLWIYALFELAAVSALLSAFNLLPAYPMDGGRIFRAMMAMRFGERAASRAACVASCAVILLLLVAGIDLAFRSGRSFTLLTAALWLLAYCISDRRRR
jgi:stage IV sporulation protein FB